MGLLRVLLAVLGLVAVVNLSACSKPSVAPKELPQLLGTDAERGTP